MFVVRARQQGGGEFDRWYGSAVVGYDKAAARKIIALKDLWHETHAKETDIYEMYLWVPADVPIPLILPGSIIDAALSPEQDAKYENEDWVSVPSLVDPGNWREQAERIDCPQLVIGETGFWYFGYLKHTDLAFTTTEINYEDLLRSLLEETEDMGKAKQSKLWDTIRTGANWKGSKAEFEALYGAIGAIDVNNLSALQPIKPLKKAKSKKVTT